MSEFAAVREVLDRIVFRLGLIEEAVTVNNERLERIMSTQDQINTDVTEIMSVLTDFAAEWGQISQRLAMEAPQIDTSKLDAAAAQAQQMDAAWKAQLAADAGGTGTPAGTTTAGSSGTSPEGGSTVPAGDATGTGDATTAASTGDTGSAGAGTTEATATEATAAGGDQTAPAGA